MAEWTSQDDKLSTKERNLLGERTMLMSGQFPFLFKLVLWQVETKIPVWWRRQQLVGTIERSGFGAVAPWSTAVIGKSMERLLWRTRKLKIGRPVLQES